MIRIYQLLLLSIIVVGCSNPDPQNGSLESGSDSVSRMVPSEPLSASDEPTLAAYINDNEGMLVPGNVTSRPSSVEELESKLRSIDWERAEHPPQVILSHTVNIDDIRATGSFAAKSVDDKLIMYLSYVDSSGGHQRLKCDTVKSLDEIVALFNSYYLNDDKWREMVTWATE